LYTKLSRTKFLENLKIFSDCSIHGSQLCSIKKFLSDINNLYNLENNAFLSSLIEITIKITIFNKDYNILQHILQLLIKTLSRWFP